MAGIRFDATINVGTIISLIVVLLGLLGATSRLEHRLSVLETRMEPMWQAFEYRAQTVLYPRPP